MNRSFSRLSKKQNLWRRWNCAICTSCFLGFVGFRKGRIWTGECGVGCGVKKRGVLWSIWSRWVGRIETKGRKGVFEWGGGRMQGQFDACVTSNGIDGNKPKDGSKSFYFFDYRTLITLWKARSDSCERK